MTNVSRVGIAIAPAVHNHSRPPKRSPAVTCTTLHAPVRMNEESSSTPPSGSNEESINFARNSGRGRSTSKTTFTERLTTPASVPTVHAAAISEITVTVGPRSARPSNESAMLVCSIGSASTIALNTSACTSSSRSTMPNAAIASTVSGNSANSAK